MRSSVLKCVKDENNGLYLKDGNGIEYRTIWDIRQIKEEIVCQEGKQLFLINTPLSL